MTTSECRLVEPKAPGEEAEGLTPGVRVGETSAEKDALANAARDLE